MHIDEVLRQIGAGLWDNKLRFYAKADLLVSYPGAMLQPGYPSKYVGRKLKTTDAGNAYVAVQEPTCFEAGTPEAERIKHILKEVPTPLWAADPATAKECGIVWQQLEFQDGEWCPSYNFSQ